MASRPRHDWYLEDWITASGLTPARLREITGWSKRKMSELINGQMRYNRDVINEAADAMNIAPFELLLHPSEANDIKSLRAVVTRQAVRLAAADDHKGFTAAPPEDAPLRPRRKAN